MDTKVADIVAKLELAPHPEGGFYRETYRSDLNLPVDALPGDFAGARDACTAIYYLLGAGDFSAFHRIRSDEIWHFYDGDPLLIHVLMPAGDYYQIRLGRPAGDGCVPQAVVPAGAWFASEPAQSARYALVGCTLAPGFDFADFEMADAAPLSTQFPNQRPLIERLTR